MLQELRVRDFAIIDNVGLSFGSGLNILSGETGAGKSVLLKSLGLMMGGKASPEMVRAGAEQAVVEGSFDISKRPDVKKLLKDMGLDEMDGTLIVRRLVQKEGKSRVYINGSLSPLSALQDLVAPLVEVTGRAAPLIEMTGQHENRNLLSKAYHLNLVDRFADAMKERAEIHAFWSELQATLETISALEEATRTRHQRLDFLIFQRDEIQSLELSPGEETSLENEYKRLKNASQLQVWAEMAESALYSDDDSALVRLHRVLQKAQELSIYDPSLDGRLEPLRQAKALMEDAVYEIRTYGEDLNAEPERLQEIEKRLSELRGLQKKHGAQATDILEALDEIEKEIRTLEGADEDLSAQRKHAAELKLTLKAKAETLHEKRQKAGKKLEAAVNKELIGLNMKGVMLRISIEKFDELCATGISDIEFMIQGSKKEEARPLAKIASGGEMSRILLVLKEIIGQSDLPRTYLFDEVDTGVSGPTAEKVGKKLKVIAKGQQVICVTHLPQVAACGDQHFLIDKVETNGNVNTEVRRLKKSERVHEIARLISGEKITKTSLAHATQLLN